MLTNIFTVFFSLANPASTEANPKFMKKTKIAESNTHIVSIIIVLLILIPLTKIKKGDKDTLNKRTSLSPFSIILILSKRTCVVNISTLHIVTKLFILSTIDF